MKRKSVESPNLQKLQRLKLLEPKGKKRRTGFLVNEIFRERIPYNRHNEEIIVNEDVYTYQKDKPKNVIHHRESQDYIDEDDDYVFEAYTVQTHDDSPPEVFDFCYRVGTFDIECYKKDEYSENQYKGWTFTTFKPKRLFEPEVYPEPPIEPIEKPLSQELLQTPTQYFSDFKSKSKSKKSKSKKSKSKSKKSKSKKSKSKSKKSKSKSKKSKSKKSKSKKSTSKK